MKIHLKLTAPNRTVRWLPVFSRSISMPQLCCLPENHHLLHPSTLTHTQPAHKQNFTIATAINLGSTTGLLYRWHTSFSSLKLGQKNWNFISFLLYNRKYLHPPTSTSGATPVTKLFIVPPFPIARVKLSSYWRAFKQALVLALK